MNFHQPMSGIEVCAAPVAKLVTDLAHGECRFAIGEDEEGRHLFCAAVTDRGFPYCQHHQAIAWRDVPAARGCSIQVKPTIPALPSKKGTARQHISPAMPFVPKATLGHRFDGFALVANALRERELISQAFLKQLELERRRKEEIAEMKAALERYRTSLPKVICATHEQKVPRPSINLILHSVAAATCVPLVEIKSARRMKDSVRARQITMYLAKTMTPLSLPEIGRRVGRRDHTTVLHSFRKYESIMAEDGAEATFVRSIIASIDEVIAESVARTSEIIGSSAKAERGCGGAAE